jgi:hypothetical protein
MQLIEGGSQRQTAPDAAHQDNDGLFLGYLLNRRDGTGEPDQQYRVRFSPVALPGDEAGAAGVGDGQAEVNEPVVDAARVLH